MLSPTPTPVAHPQATSHPPRLDAFTSAAAAGQMLWVAWVDGRPQVCSGARPQEATSDQVGELFVTALREHFGEAAAGIAEREWHLGQRPRRLLPARTVHRAVACAESALSLLMAQSLMLRLDFSAVLAGWRFLKVAESLGLDPAAINPERRVALDLAIELEFKSAAVVDADAVAARLRALLTQAIH